ncbi:MAG: hypothetical protein HOM36_03580 [Phycisphaerae bacterium]|nr:hypothetical protein [Phycisphaerae bacterium]
MIYLPPDIGQAPFQSPQSLGSHALLEEPAAAGLVSFFILFSLEQDIGQSLLVEPAAAGLVIFFILFALEHDIWHSLLVEPAAAGLALLVVHAVEPQHASAEALHDVVAADVAPALTLLVLLQPATAKPIIVTKVSVNSCFISNSPIGG